MKNRFMLAPLTNSQSHDDGIMSDAEFNWLSMRARGGFGLTMTCAAHVQANGQGFPGQMAVYADAHIPGLRRLASEIKAHGSISNVQLHHAGMRSPAELIASDPVCPSENAEFGARALTTEEVKTVIADFVAAAVRVETAGFEGVEIHGAHGYIVCQFLSSETNQREDQYGGTLENRSRLLFEIIDGIRDQCSENFNIGVRLSPERFGIKLTEALSVSQKLMNQGKIDFLDMSLWDCFKEPVEPEFQGRSLLSYFTELDRGDVRLGVAGKIRTPADAEKIIASGVDWVMLGRAAILHYDFPNQYQNNSDFEPVDLPVSRKYLNQQGLADIFVEYMNNWKGFVAEAE
ncbi:MAG: NADH:flavin oxidoreductase [Pseudomonadales bacterium]|nr:NADH:flavin oxidoreductase [Pseudomonadales bacterium]